MNEEVKTLRLDETLFSHIRSAGFGEAGKGSLRPLGWTCTSAAQQGLSRRRAAPLRFGGSWSSGVCEGVLTRVWTAARVHAQGQWQEGGPDPSTRPAVGRLPVRRGPDTHTVAQLAAADEACAGSARGRSRPSEASPLRTRVCPVPPPSFACIATCVDLAGCVR